MKTIRAKRGGLPRLMVAPNGARLTKADHSQIPVTIEEIVETAEDCRAQGADGIHAHIRDQDQNHILDVGLYQKLINELKLKLPGFYVQVTTESVDLYSPSQQRDLVYELAPPAVSIALREIESDDDLEANSRLFHWTREHEVDVQHILYEPQEILLLKQRVKEGIIPADRLQLLFVLGRYTKNQVSDPGTVQVYADELERSGLAADWAVCAFGINESDCLHQAFALGGKARIGFENNILNSDGSIAKSNAERVNQIMKKMAPIDTGS